MKGSILSERIKVTSTKLWWILILVGVGLTVLLDSLPAVLVLEDSDLQKPEQIQALWSGLGAALVIALIIGIIATTGEFRHRTITESFLLEPDRSKFLSAKIIVQAAVGVVLAIACVAAGVLATLALLSSRSHAPIDWAFVGQVAIGVVVAFALYAILGVAVGALLPNQALAIVIALLWVMLVEPILTNLLPRASFIPDDLGKWFPGSAAQSVIDGAVTGVDQSASLTYLPMWAGVLLLLGYALAFTLIAMRTTLRRDVT